MYIKEKKPNEVQLNIHADFISDLNNCIAMTSFNADALKSVLHQPCNFCAKDGRLRCSICKTWYCTVQCQAYDWPLHKKSCSPPPALELPDGTLFKEVVGRPVKKEIPEEDDDVTIMEEIKVEIQAQEEEDYVEDEISSIGEEFGKQECRRNVSKRSCSSPSIMNLYTNGREVRRRQELEKRKSVKRMKRCGYCVNCTASDCMKCKYCFDMKKYGGRGVLRKVCSRRLQCKMMYCFVTLSDVEGRGDNVQARKRRFNNGNLKVRSPKPLAKVANIFKASRK